MAGVMHGGRKGRHYYTTALLLQHV